MHARTQAAALLALLLAARPAACAADSEFDDPDFADFDDDEAEATTGGLAGDDFLRENRKNPKVTQLPSGLQYKVLASGSGLEGRPGKASMCTVHYEGKLLSGEVFDSSMARGEPMTFQANQVIAGWTEALTLMTPGDRWQLTIPSDLAYGERGGGSKIPPNSVLVFEVELLSFREKGLTDFATPMNLLAGGYLLWSVYSKMFGTAAPRGEPAAQKAD